MFRRLTHRVEALAVLPVLRAFVVCDVVVSPCITGSPRCGTRQFLDRHSKKDRAGVTSPRGIQRLIQATGGFVDAAKVVAFEADNLACRPASIEKIVSRPKSVKPLSLSKFT